MDVLDTKFIQSLIDKCKWTLAKTMPGIPHEYIVRGRCDLTDEEFIAFINAQREHGVIERWGKYVHPYLYLNGYKYWTMGASTEETTVMNRQRIRIETERLGAKDLFKDYQKIHNIVDHHFNTREQIDLPTSIRIKRVACMLRAFTQTNETDDWCVIRDFLNPQADWISKSAITDNKFEELKRIFFQMAYHAINDYMLERIAQPKQRINCIESLIRYLEKSNNLLNAFSDHLEGSVGSGIAYQLTTNMYNPVLKYNNEKLYDIIVLLLGSMFEQTFTKDELIINFDYPKETDKQLDEWLVDNL